MRRSHEAMSGASIAPDRVAAAVEPSARRVLARAAAASPRQKAATLRFAARLVGVVVTASFRSMGRAHPTSGLCRLRRRLAGTLADTPAR
jgi:hypothetical protein